MIELMQAIDNFILQLMLEIQNPGLTKIMQVLTFFGNPAFWFLIAAIFYWLGKENESSYLTTLILASTTITALIKTIIAKPRPSVIPNNEGIDLLSSNYDKYSFPSGHATMISSAFTYFFNEIKKRTKLIFALLVLIILFSRLYLGKHFLSDVIAGLILGLFIGFIAAEIKEKYIGKKFNWQGKKVLFLTLIIILMIILLVLSRNEDYALAFLGYFSGFLLFKRFNLKIKIIKNKKQLIERLALGFTVLGFLITIPLIYAGIIASIFIALIGLWISFFYPLIIIAIERKDLNNSLSK